MLTHPLAPISAPHATLLQPRACQLGNPAAAAQERISFDPHPKTLTMAGDYEYFAAQGHHPLAFALAELIDNALRATKANDAAGRRRAITVSLATDERAGRGLVAVRDNGCGMGVSELGSWAVMNLSMEDRGLLPSNPGAADEGKRECGSGSSGSSMAHGDKRTMRACRAAKAAPGVTAALALPLLPLALSRFLPLSPGSSLPHPLARQPAAAT